MKFGLAIFPNEDIQLPDELGRMAQERGFESLFFPEHTHIPADRQTPHPSGQELPREYTTLLDPFVAVTAAAVATDTLLVGTGVCLVIERDPIITAKEVATVDLLSGGRFLFGIGAGWNIEEMSNHGTDPSRRFGRMRESVEAMKAIWTNDVASYHGEQISFERIWSWPKPVQNPHPPILIGGNGELVIKRVVRYGDEWFPNRVAADEIMIPRFESLARAAREAGREPIPISVSGMTRDPARIERFEQYGVHRCVYWLPPADRDAVEATMDRVAAAADAYARAGA